MRWDISKEFAPKVDIFLKRGEQIRGESDSILQMSDNIDLTPDLSDGLLAGLTRLATGEPLFMSMFTCEGKEGVVSFTTDYIGRILAFPLSPNLRIICQRGSFVCASATVTLRPHLTYDIALGLFGREGFVLQEFTGPGYLFVEFDGGISEYKLEDGQSRLVSPGRLAAYEPSVSTDLVFVNKARNWLFGHQGLFWIKVTGHGQGGKIWLQNMPKSYFVKKLKPIIFLEEEE